MFSANIRSPKINSVIMEPFSIPKVAKNGQKEPDFEISEFKLFVFDSCISKDSFRQ